jgi:hypothetical protein
MPPSGEIFLATDAYGTTWLVHPPGAGGPDKISPAAVEATVQEAVARYGWDRVEQSFASWADLDNARQQWVAERNPLPPLDVSGFDEHDVRRVLRVVTSWLAAGDSARGRPALHRLLRDAPAVRRDDQLYEEVTRLLLRLDEQVDPPPFSTLTVSDSSRGQEALQRLQLPQAA